MLIGYKSKYRLTKWQKFVAWCKLPANRVEECLGVIFIAIGAAIGLELAVIALVNLSVWGL